LECYAGIDWSLELSSVCILHAAGRIIREAKVARDPEALATFCASLNLPLTRNSLEAAPRSQRLHIGVVQAGFEFVLLETRHVKAAFSAMIVKTDRRDARGIGQLARMELAPARALQVAAGARSAAALSVFCFHFFKLCTSKDGRCNPQQIPTACR
jgi:transposase